MGALTAGGVDGGFGEHLKITSGILAVLGGAVALFISFRKQHSTERELEIKERDLASRDQALKFTREKDIQDRELAETKDQRDLQLATRREYRDRFAAGVTLLGDSEPTIALAGVYALANLADDWGDGAQQCLDILCARLRLPWPKKTELPPHADPDDETSWWDDGEREIRTTILRTITTHLKEPDPTDEDPERTKPGPWSPLDIDLTSAHLPDVIFTRAHFVGDARFESVTFTGETRFAVATFTGDAVFGGATFASIAMFEHTTFTGETRFAVATFTGDAVFDYATFTGSATFAVARFAAGAWFDYATFTRTVVFELATFTGDATFEHTEFTGGVTFTSAKFDREAYVDHVTRNAEPFKLEDLIRKQTNKYPPVDDEGDPGQDG